MATDEKQIFDKDRRLKANIWQGLHKKANIWQGSHIKSKYLARITD